MMRYHSSLTGKKALFVGDSISYGSADGIGGQAWAGRLARDYGLQSHNASVSGWSFSTIRTGRITDQILNAPQEEFDYVILHGGVNDAWGDGEMVAPEGQVTRSYDPAYFDVTTYAGGLEELIYETYRKYPTATVGYIINFDTPEAKTVGRLTSIADYYAKGMEICKKWGVHVLDLYHDDVVNHQIMEVHTLNYMADAVHPNAAGYERLTPVIARWMETLVPNSKNFALVDSRAQVTKVLQPGEWQAAEPTLMATVPQGIRVWNGIRYGKHLQGLCWLASQITCRLAQPADLTGCHTVGFDYYLEESMLGKSGQIKLELLSGDKPFGLSLYFGIDMHRAGWHRIVFDLNEPRLREGNVDLSAINRLRFSRYNHNACIETSTTVLGDVFCMNLLVE